MNAPHDRLDLEAGFFCFGIKPLLANSTHILAPASLSDHHLAKTQTGLLFYFGSVSLLVHFSLIRRLQKGHTSMINVSLIIIITASGCIDGISIACHLKESMFYCVFLQLAYCATAGLR